MERLPDQIFQSPARALPHSEESERAVLAAILLSPHLLPTVVAGRLDAADFYLERHKLVHQAMLELAADGVEIDLRTLQAAMERAGTFEKTGGMAHLAGLDLDLPDLGRKALPGRPRRGPLTPEGFPNRAQGQRSATLGPRRHLGAGFPDATDLPVRRIPAARRIPRGGASLTPGFVRQPPGG